MARSSMPLAPARVEYPSSDGQPMAETDHQRTALTYAVEALRQGGGSDGREDADAGQPPAEGRNGH